MRSLEVKANQFYLSSFELRNNKRLHKFCKLSCISGHQPGIHVSLNQITILYSAIIHNCLMNLVFFYTGILFFTEYISQSETSEA